MRKLSEKVMLKSVGLLLLGTLAISGCGQEASAGGLSPTPESHMQDGTAGTDPKGTGSTPDVDMKGESGDEKITSTPIPNGDNDPTPVMNINSNPNPALDNENTPTPISESDSTPSLASDSDSTPTPSSASDSDSTPSPASDGDITPSTSATLTPADFTIRVADNAGTQSRGTAGRILATGEDLEGISPNNIIFYFTDAFKKQVEEKNAALLEEGKLSDTAGRVLGADKNIYDIELWIADECIYTGNLRKYLGYEEQDFMTAGSWEEDSPYYGVLTLMDDGGASVDATAYREVSKKLHAFAQEAGLVMETEPIVLTEPGRCRTEQEYLVDLDGDGTKERILYGQSSLLINGVNYIEQMNYRDNPATDCFYLWDIDPQDGQLEIGIWSYGPSNDDHTHLYSYNKESLEYIGLLPGAADMAVLDGNGKIRVNCRLGILQTWFADMDFCLDENHQLALVEQELYFVEAPGTEEYRYTLLSPVRLYETMDEHGNYSILEAGAQMAFPATDDQCFVQVLTEDGKKGYLYLLDGNKLENPDGGDYNWAWDVIEGLCFAD